MNRAALVLETNVKTLQAFLCQLEQLGLEEAVRTVWPKQAFYFGGVNNLVFFAWLADSIGNSGKRFLKELGERLHNHEQKYPEILRAIRNSSFAPYFQLPATLSDNVTSPALPALPALSADHDVYDIGRRCTNCTEEFAQVVLSCGHFYLCCRCYNESIRWGMRECQKCDKTITTAIVVRK